MDPYSEAEAGREDRNLLSLALAPVPQGNVIATGGSSANALFGAYVWQQCLGLRICYSLQNHSVFLGLEIGQHISKQ